MLMSAKYLEYVVKTVTILKGVLNAFADLAITWDQTAAVAKPLVSTQLLYYLYTILLGSRTQLYV